MLNFMGLPVFAAQVSHHALQKTKRSILNNEVPSLTIAQAVRFHPGARNHREHFKKSLKAVHVLNLSRPARERATALRCGRKARAAGLPRCSTDPYIEAS